jgi:hypothetical protein
VLSAHGHRAGVAALAVASFAMLALALAWPLASLLPWALAAAGAAYAVRLAGGPLDEWAPVYAGGFLAVAELAYWSVELRGRAHEAGRLTDRRLALIASVSLLGVVAGAAILAATALGIGSGVATDVVGVAAAVGTVAVVASLARRA